MNGFADQGLDEGDFERSSSNVISVFDAFPKTKRSYQEGTKNGVLWTILLAFFAIWLTSTEFWRWMEGTTTTHFSVEKGVAHDLQINIDVVIPMQCEDLHVNVQDASGDRILAAEMLSMEPTMWYQWNSGVMQDKLGRKIRKGDLQMPWYFYQQAHEYKRQEDVHDRLRLTKHKRYWPKTPRFNKGDSADSCRIYGSVEGNKVQGDFHITARGHGYQTMQFEHLDHSKFNFSHHINELSFGPFFPSINQPLDNVQSTTDRNFYKYQYYLSVVPTIYTDAAHKLEHSTDPAVMRKRARAAGRGEPRRRQQQGELLRYMLSAAPSEPNAAMHRAGPSRWFALSDHTVYTNQYAVTEQGHAVGESGVPGVFFKYDIEPILLTVSEEWGGFLGLILRCINVVAGVLVAGAWVVSLMGWAGENFVKRRQRSSSSAGGLLHSASDEKKSAL